jgi:hypothetical protein
MALAVDGTNLTSLQQQSHATREAATRLTTSHKNKKFKIKDDFLTMRARIGTYRTNKEKWTLKITMVY